MVSDETLLKTVQGFTDVDDSPVASPTDVAESLPINREAVRQRLLKMAADGDVQTRKVGRSRVFWVPEGLAPEHPAPEDRIITTDDDVDDWRVHGDAPRELVIEDDAEDRAIGRLQLQESEEHDRIIAGTLRSFADGLESSAPEGFPGLEDTEVVIDEDDRPGGRADHAGDTPGTDADLSDVRGRDLRDLADVETPPSTPSREAFEGAALALLEHVRSEGSTTRSEAQEAVHAEHPAGYDDARTWWRRVARPTLEAHPDVKKPPSGASRWQHDA